MDYDKLSDFEINKAVAEALGRIVKPDSFYLPIFKERYPNRVWVQRTDQAHSEHKDYCNNPSDAWPIITTLIKDFDDVRFSSDMVEVNTGTTGKYDYAESNNPLRAAMIVFLKMQEE